jgi:glucosamine-6-phosphate deaminase
MRIVLSDTYRDMSRKAAYIVASQIILNPRSVLGLATGDTPLGLYRMLISMYWGGDLDFSGITTFNLDEYHGLSEESPYSYHYYMKQNLFQHINIKEEQCHIPRGTAENVEEECRLYDRAIEAVGGIDLQILGLGVDGHIGFNEPDEKFEGGTHLVELQESTLRSNARFFPSPDEVPRFALSMGIKSIMKAKKILLLASGASKADAIYEALRGEVNPELPASILQLHPEVTCILDRNAASRLEAEGEEFFLEKRNS